MSVAPEDQRPDVYERFRQQARSFFDAQLERLGLSEKQIKQQDVTALEDSLVRIDDALRSPESFGLLRVSITSNATVVLLKSNSEAHLQIGVVPILLERKALVIERLRSLRRQRPITNLADLIDSISDAGLREQLRTELEAGRKVSAGAETRSSMTVGTAFIAMAMDPNDPSLEDVLDAIKDAAKTCGVTAERVDEQHSNEPITSRMLTAIESAEFVVVDLTYARPNVFYEAGFAQGLGKTPIYIARKGSEIPFDVKDYPVIVYPNMRELRHLLRERLTAVRTGRGRISK
ncbi:MAG: hypothetical protein V7638_2552 [Acidobacteriota bacterium]|jgi:hypothetical protein